MIDPYSRWPEPGRKPPYAGLPTFAELPYSEDPADLDGVDVAVVGAPFDWLASDRVGSRDGPRAIRIASRPMGPEVGTSVDPNDLRVIDYGDAPVAPFDIEASRAAIETTVGQVVAAGAIPFVLGGDHSITLPALRACAAKHGPLGLVHFDSHTDTGIEVYEHTDNHGTMMRALVEDGHVDPTRYVQVGLRGFWPNTDVFDWQAEQGITYHTAYDVQRRGIADVVTDVLETIGHGPAYLSVDIDVLDPTYAPNTGTPEAGGLEPRELLVALRKLSQRVEFVGCDIVETVPAGWGTSDPGALTAAAVVTTTLTGIAALRS